MWCNIIAIRCSASFKFLGLVIYSCYINQQRYSNILLLYFYICPNKAPVICLSILLRDKFMSFFCGFMYYGAKMNLAGALFTRFNCFRNICRFALWFFCTITKCLSVESLSLQFIHLEQKTKSNMGN